MGNTKKQNFIQGASVLMASMIIVKIIGAVFKLPLTDILTVTGMAYFNASYTIFTTVYALTVTGLATAVARMVAVCSAKSRYRDCKKILRVSTRIFLLLGVLGTAIMAIFANGFSDLIAVPNSRYSIMVMAPAIFFSCIMAAYRGYYEGMRNMTPTAVSQVVEVITKLLAGLLFAYAVIAYAQNQFQATGEVFGTVVDSLDDARSVALPIAAAGAMLGVTVSTFFGFLYMFIKFKRNGPSYTQEEYEASPKPVTTKAIIKKLVKTSLPITMSAVVINLTAMIDLLSITNRLEATCADNASYFNSLYGEFLGKGDTMHEFIYGSYTLAIVVFNLVPAFTQLFGKSALPNVTTAWVNGNKKDLKLNIESVVRMTALIAFPAGIGIFSMAPQIVDLLYNDTPGAIQAVPDSLRMLGISAIFLALVGPMYAILQGVGRFDLPVKFMLIGATLKLSINFILVGIPTINIKGAAVGTGVCYMLILVLCVTFIMKLTKVKLNIMSIFIKPLISASACGLTAFLIGMLSDSRIVTIIAIGCAGVVYVVSLLLIKALSRDDILMIPKGAKIVSKLEKYHLIDSVKE